jgi:hypothetical protein
VHVGGEGRPRQRLPPEPAAYCCSRRWNSMGDRNGGNADEAATALAMPIRGDGIEPTL